ncbi:MAG: DUF115 domain-containing protein [Spirochaetaceae bacterium]|nr:MAG: DUF115 domain-containing protein [Spirochaetaceae bacterium]
MSGVERHLRAIEQRDADLADRLRRVAPARQISVFPARTGVLTAEAASADGVMPPRLLHSRIDPQREAERTVAAIEPRGFIVCMGLGLGHQIARLLQHDAVTMVLVVDYDLGMVRALLEKLPHNGLFDDPRVNLVVDEEPRTLAHTVADRYVPIVHGDLRVVPLRGRVDADPERFSAAAQAVRDAVDASVGDFSVQQLFGRRWMRNMVINLIHAGRPAPSLPRLSRAVVTAAGPSLDDSLPSLLRREPHEAIVATDSSLSALSAAGVRPTLTVAVDAQQISYLHAMGDPDSLGTLVADLGVAPAVARRFAGVHWVAGDHPLIALLRSRGVGIPHLPTGDGSVTHTAVRLARALGAREVSVIGADFGYPRAAAYARGCYLPVHAVQHGCRLKPAHSWLYRFVLDRPGVRWDENQTPGRYTTAVLDRYRKQLTIALESDAAPTAANAGHPDGQPSAPGSRGSTTICTRTRAILLEYAGQLSTMAAPTEPVWRFLSELSAEEQNLWTTLFPLAAYYHRSGATGSHPNANLHGSTPPHPLEQARREAVQLIRQLVG